MRTALTLLLCFAAAPAHPAGMEALKESAGFRFDGGFPKVSEAELPPALKAFAVPEHPLEQGELLRLSELAERLSKTPGALEALLEAAERSTGSWSLSPAQKERLLRLIRETDKAGLDKFPTLTQAQTLASLRAFAESKGPLPDVPPAAGVETLVLAGTPRRPSQSAYLADVGFGVRYGDIVRMDLSSAHGDNVAVAAALDRLAMGDPGHALSFDGASCADVGGFFRALLASGHSVEVADKRFFANFGDLWLEEDGRLRPVSTPLLIDTGLKLPSGKDLVLPAPHAHLAIAVRGPRVIADINFYMGVDGAASFRPESTADQRWVGGRTLALWTGEEAVRILERAATARRELAAKVRKYGLPLGGYGTLGACTDIHSMIIGEPIFPQTADGRYYQDGMSIDAWAKAVVRPAGAAWTPKELYQSLPFQDYRDIPIPELREQVRELQRLAGR